MYLAEFIRKTKQEEVPPQPKPSASVKSAPASQPKHLATADPAPTPQPKPSAPAEPIPASQPKHLTAADPIPTPQPKPPAPVNPSPAPQPKPSAASSDQPAENRVMQLIKALGTPENTEEFRKKLGEARWAYNNLSVKQKCLVQSYYSHLTSAEAAYKALRDKAAAHERARKTRNRWIVSLCSLLVVCIAGITFFKWPSSGSKTKAEQLSAAFINQASQGDTFLLGRYEQDNNWANGAEDIEWVVVRNTDDAILAVSKYCLDNRPYNDTESYEVVDWEHCTLRKWLNGALYDSAFSEDEKSWIAAVDLQNPDALFYRFPGGYNTGDKVFLLSCADLTSNFKDYQFALSEFTWEDSDARMLMTTSNTPESDLFRAKYTDYARETYIQAQKQTWKSRTEEALRSNYSETEAKYGDGVSLWWLRSPGNDQYSTMIVTLTGQASSVPSQSKSIGVRPAIMVRKPYHSKSSATIDESVFHSISSIGDASITERGKENLSQILYGDQQVILLANSGTVKRLAYFGNEFLDWNGIQKIAAGDDIVIGLTDDGRVLLSKRGKEIYGTDTLPLEGIVDICICPEAYGPSDSTKKGCIVALADDSTAYFTYADGYKGQEQNVQSISASFNKVAIAFKNGSVEGMSFDGEDYSGINEWSDVVQVVCGEYYIAGLRSDGTVVVCGTYLSGVLNGAPYFPDVDSPVTLMNVNFDLSDWTNIVSLSGGRSHLVGLKSDGTVVASGLNTYGQCNTEGWENIVRIEAGNDTTIGYLSDVDFQLTGKDIINNIQFLEDKTDAFLHYSW